MKTQAPLINPINLNGKNTTLTEYLLNAVDRPLPQSPTHYLLAEVLNTDLSIKRITIYFNPKDTWEGNRNFIENSPQSVGLAICSGLQFLNSDPNTLAYKCWVIDIATDSVVHQFSTHSFNRCRY